MRGAVVARRPASCCVEVEITPGKANRARVNRSPVPRAREVLGILRTVLFAPEDLALVKGDPAERRRFLDDLLVLRTPRLAGVRADYERVLKQRNALLKSAGAAPRAPGSGDLRTLDVWDAHLATAGAELLAGRLDLVDALRPLRRQGVRRGRRVGRPAGRPRIDYRSLAGRRRSPLGRRPRRARRRAARRGSPRPRKAELERGVTLVGPHRDDLVLELGPLPAKGYASHGESWSFALALRLAAYDLLRAEPTRRRAGAGARRRVRRARRPAGASGWPSWSPAPSRCWSPPPCPADVPEALAGARVDVMGGEVRRVR